MLWLHSPRMLVQVSLPPLRARTSSHTHPLRYTSCSCPEIVSSRTPLFPLSLSREALVPPSIAYYSAMRTTPTHSLVPSSLPCRFAMRQTPILFVLVLLCALMMAAKPVSAECCTKAVKGYFFNACNGKGPCNVFCCNCDGGCATTISGGPLLASGTHLDLFNGTDITPPKK